MADNLTADPSADRTGTAAAAAPCDDLAEDVLAEDVLVEEVSIDGMCGVY